MHDALMLLGAVIIGGVSFLALLIICIYVINPRAKEEHKLTLNRKYDEGKLATLSQDGKADFFWPILEDYSKEGLMIVDAPIMLEPTDGESGVRRPLEFKDNDIIVKKTRFSELIDYKTLQPGQKITLSLSEKTANQYAGQTFKLYNQNHEIYLEFPIEPTMILAEKEIGARAKNYLFNEAALKEDSDQITSLADISRLSIEAGIRNC